MFVQPSIISWIFVDAERSLSRNPWYAAFPDPLLSRKISGLRLSWMRGYSRNPQPLSRGPNSVVCGCPWCMAVSDAWLSLMRGCPWCVATWMLREVPGPNSLMRGGSEMPGPFSGLKEWANIKPKRTQRQSKSNVWNQNKSKHKHNSNV